MLKSEEKTIFWNMMSLWGCLLVVIGHSLIPPNDARYNELVKLIHTWIYSFHMPLFAFVSGACFVEYTLKHYNVKSFMKNKIRRILLPYCWWSIFACLLAIFFSSLAVNKKMMDINYFILCLIDPRNNVVGYYWFLIALFMVFLSIPLLLKIFRKSKWNIFIMTFVLLVMNITNPLSSIYELALYKYFDLLFYFWVGMVFSRYNNMKISKIESICYTVLLFCLMLYFTIIGVGYIFKPIVAIIGIAFSICLIKMLIYKGVHIFWRISYSIYLLHGFAQGIPYVLFYNKGLYWYELSIIWILAGIVIPIIVVAVWKRVHFTSYRLLLGQ